MRKLLVPILLLLAACMQAQQLPKPEPYLGYNNTRLMDLITDPTGKMIPERIELLKSLPAKENKVARWPMGAGTRSYDFDKPGYGDVNGGKRTENYVFEFIRLCKIMEWSVTIVFNVTPEYLDASQTAIWQDKNMRMLDEFVKAKIPILAVEVGGNESNMHCVLNGLKGEYQEKPNLVNKMLKTNERFETEMQKYYSITLAYHKLVKSKYPHLKTAATFGSVFNARDRKWNSIMAGLPTDMGVFHWYQENTDSKTWDKTFQQLIAPIVNSKKTPICTEYAWNFGPDSQKNSSLAGSPINDQYCNFFIGACKKYGVAIALRHRIAGSDEDGIVSPYNAVSITK